MIMYKRDSLLTGRAERSSICFLLSVLCVRVKGAGMPSEQGTLGKCRTWSEIDHENRIFLYAIPLSQKFSPFLLALK